MLLFKSSRVQISKSNLQISGDIALLENLFLHRNSRCCKIWILPSLLYMVLLHTRASGYHIVEFENELLCHTNVNNLPMYPKHSSLTRKNTKKVMIMHISFDFQILKFSKIFAPLFCITSSPRIMTKTIFWCTTFRHRLTIPINTPSVASAFCSVHGRTFFGFADIGSINMAAPQVCARIAKL